MLKNLRFNIKGGQLHIEDYPDAAGRVTRTASNNLRAEGIWWTPRFTRYHIIHRPG